MTREEARAKYLELRSAGFNHEDAADALRTGQSEDPTAPYWEHLINQESGGQQGAVSPKGAVGIAQVMPSTGPEAAQLAGREWDERAWRSDPEYNSAIGRAYLRAQMRRFNDPELGLAAYNAGPGRVQQMLEQGRALPQETQNYVPAIAGKVEAPMSLTRDQARQYAQQRLAEGVDMATIKVELQQQMAQAPMPAAPAAPATPAPAMPAAPQVAPQQASPAPAMQPTSGVTGNWDQQAPGSDVGDSIQGMLEESWPAMSQDPGGRGIHAFSRGLSGMLRGGRQLYNQISGDDEKLRELIQQEERSRAFEQKVNPSGSGLNIQDVAKLTPEMMAFGSMKGPSTLAGAVQGAAAPVGEDESRLTNALLGAGVGAVGDVAGGAIRGVNRLVDRARNTIGSRDAIKDFTTKALRAGPDTDAIGTYKSVGSKVAAKLDELESTFSRRYKDVEGAADLPPVRILPSAKAGEEFVLSDDISGALSPKSRSVLHRLEAASKKTAKDDFPPSFEDVRNTIREIRKEARRVGRDSPSYGQLKQAENRLTDDLTVWAGRSDQTRQAFSAAKTLDKEYREQVVPFYSKKSAVGKYVGSEVMDEKALDKSFLTEKSGMAIQDLQGRVPGVKEDLRKLYGTKLREAKGDVPTIRSLESGTTAEALLSKPEREYLQKVARQIYKEGGPAQHSSVMPVGVGRLLEKGTFSEDLQRMIGGLRPYGVPEPREFISPTSKNLIRYLRAIGVDQATEE